MAKAYVRTIIAASCLGLVMTGAATAKERANFIRGSFATVEGCKKLDAIAKGGPRNVSTVPDVLTAEGFKGWEGSCEFTKVFEHEPGQSWVGLMLCVDGASLNPATYAFVKTSEDAFDVSFAGSSGEAEEWKRCPAAAAAAARENK